MEWLDGMAEVKWSVCPLNDQRKEVAMGRPEFRSEDVDGWAVSL